MLDTLYSQIARARRRYYQRRPHLRRRLAAPVISIGNLTVGGSGKTPLAAEIARMLIAAGERPSILSRGYARNVVEDGVVVVSDGNGVLTDVARSGDEPMMVAEMVPRAAVLVSSSRYLGGRVAETYLGCTVHILDDGFQHFDLMRDVDLLVAPDSLDDARTLPFGRFREPLDAAAAADALLVETEAVLADLKVSSTAGSTRDACDGNVRRDDLQVGPLLQVSDLFEFSRRLAGPLPDRPAYAFAGIARPKRFYDDLERAGWQLTGRRSFADHHHYSVREIDEIVRAAADSGAQVILTTQKDFVRRRWTLDDGRSTTQIPVIPVPLDIALAPSFQPWLLDRLRAVREPGGRA